MGSHHSRAVRYRAGAHRPARHGVVPYAVLTFLLGLLWLWLAAVWSVDPGELDLTVNPMPVPTATASP